MNTNKKMLLATVLAVCAGVLALGRPAAAYDSLQGAVDDAARIEDARTVAYSTSTTGAVQKVMTLYYVGSASEAVVTVNSTGITFYSPYNVADTSVGSSGQFAFATYTTMGALCDAINATASYTCRMRDARRSDATSRIAGYTAASGQGNLKGTQAQVNNPLAEGGFDLYPVHSGNLTDANVDTLTLGITPQPGKRVYLKKCDFNALSSGAALPTLTVSGVKRKLENINDGVSRDDSTVVWSSVIASSVTALSQAFSDGSGPDGSLEFAKGQQPTPSYNIPVGYAGRVVVRIAADVATSYQAASQYLRCYWLEK